MGATEDLARIGEQERRLCFRQFGLAEAWDLGCRIRRLAEAKGIAVAIEVRLGRRTVFQSAMPGTTARAAACPRNAPGSASGSPWSSPTPGIAHDASPTRLCPSEVTGPPHAVPEPAATIEPARCTSPAEPWFTIPPPAFAAIVGFG